MSKVGERRRQWLLKWVDYLEVKYTVPIATRFTSNIRPRLFTGLQRCPTSLIDVVETTLLGTRNTFWGSAGDPPGSTRQPIRTGHIRQRKHAALHDLGHGLDYYRNKSNGVHGQERLGVPRSFHTRISTKGDSRRPARSADPKPITFQDLKPLYSRMLGTAD